MASELPFKPRIGVWNTAFLGDSVLTLPLVQSLRTAYPDAEVHYYVRKGLGSLYKAHPAIDSVFEHDKRGSGSSRLRALRQTFFEVRSRRYDAWFSPHQSLRSALVAMATGAAHRVGFDEPWFNALCYNHRVKRRFPGLHEIDRVLELLEPLGIAPASAWPELVLRAEDKEQGRALLAPLRKRGLRVIGLHPGSVWATKRWPAEYYAKLGIRAIEQGVGVALFAGPGEEEEASAVSRAVLQTCRNRNIELDSVFADFSARLSLPVLAAALGMLDCYVTNDSGPMHIAWVQRTPVAAIFGPTIPGFGFAPRGPLTRILECDALPCRPCSLHGPQRCPLGHHRCMRDIAPERVWATVAELVGL